MLLKTWIEQTRYLFDEDNRQKRCLTINPALNHMVEFMLYALQISVCVCVYVRWKVCVCGGGVVESQWVESLVALPREGV